MSAPTTPRVFVFQCSGSTYIECIERSLFGSNTPWPLQVKAGVVVDQAVLGPAPFAAPREGRWPRARLRR